MIAWLLKNRLLVLALIAAAGVRALWLSEQCFNMDELSELVGARATVEEIVWRPDSMPPGYGLMLKGWLTLFGGDTAGRWLSSLLGVGAVACVAGAARELLGARAAVAAAWFMALMPLHVYFSQFVRSYSAFFFASALALWLLLAALRTGSRWLWGAYAVAAVAGLYVHYYFAIVLLTNLIVAMIHKRSWWISAPAVAAHAAIALAAAPLLTLMPADLALQKMMIEARPINLAAWGYTYLAFFTGGNLGPSLPELHEMPLAEAAKRMAPWAALVFAAAAVVGWEGLRAAHRRGQLGALLTLLLLPPVVIGALGYALDVTYHFRFAIACMAPLAALLGAGLVEGRRAPRVWGAAATLTLIFGLAIHSRQFNPRYENEDLRAVAGHLAEHAEAGDPVLVASPYMEPVLAYYLQSDQEIVRLPRRHELQAAGVAEEEFVQRWAGFAEGLGDGGFWLVYTRPFHADPDGELLTLLTDLHGLKLQAEAPGVTLYRSATGYGARRIGSLVQNKKATPAAEGGQPVERPSL